MVTKTKFKVTYNAPVTLTFALISVLILFLNETLFQKHLIPALFIAPGCQGSGFAFNWHSALDYFRLFSHVFGHADWNHLLSNFGFILLLGPILEERYGSLILLIMILVTAFVTGIINACLIPAALMGSSGIAFMMILLASFSTMSRHEVPLSFLLILFLYVGRELFSQNQNADVATFAHIAGGICGSMFGFLAAPKRRAAAKAKNLKDKKNQPDELPPAGANDKSIAQQFADFTLDENSPRFKNGVKIKRH